MIWIVGIVSGFVLGGFLYIFQHWTAIPVYTLLMNVDYFPVLSGMDLPNWLEFSFHLAVSVAVVWILYLVLKKKNLEQRLMPYVFCNTVIGLLIFPTTMLSDRTPEIGSTGAWIIWLTGHMVYGISVWGMLRIGKWLKEKRYES
ncbi:hypothetical protein [Oceanobacillus jeddahense]|uniref:DUF1440 domain-containing protein n=1 Tax=Oceanobacillus jeddahense TaxID=1462527 RepID=A0ABY5JR02_9BACI|nr:hypothetical protein [Oceanobacillus jeddahense]UUI02715.1 hypothetical protein NP439_22200 [Oceanobacillus jeddahense]